MRIFKPVLLEYVGVLAKLILYYSRDSAFLKMARQCQYLALDIIGYLALNQQLDPRTEEKSYLASTTHHLKTSCQC
ncbi:hypothetical protein F4820DRAFT_426115 [Hypoxylon rubiginosum]|uniref:Uncharacterized protein n=1 Tax=Hypoxylon rubiginosum TaxID=110542 RepID=A0ACB9YWG1_9PEZI|nr:hypothetical protein F4820DRAFT_426115 [Hypoxylon rubiginosum]